MLSASEILSEGNKSSQLPHSGGLKYFKLDEDNEEQKETVESALQQYSEALKEQRVCKKMNLSVAEWQPSENVALVNTIKGSTLQKFGYQTRSGKFLFPEEALFLLEQGILELCHEDIQLSLQEAYMLLLPALPSHEYYQVFAHLCRQGFVVKRHKPHKSDASESRQFEAPDTTTSILMSSSDATTEYKEGEEIPESLTTGYMKHLWENSGAKPLVKPSDATSTASILSKLKQPTLVHLNSYCDEASARVGEEKNVKFRIDFDVYVTKERKEKNRQNTSLPHFRVLVCKYTDTPPSILELARLTKESNGVHIKIGVVNQGTVTFYGKFSVDLPILITPR